ncbi:MAG: polyphosphate polymerase domain-containing protein [Sedimentisphaerales bacterium]|nr:polyphosphate polymerase domain-containing protein [Sedimentisphaerales bacterium]
MTDNQSAKRDSTPTRSISHRDSRSDKKRKSVELGGDRTLGCRYELKYHITESTAAAIARYVGHYLEMDRYSKLQRKGDYPIVSLYLDSADLQLCRESLRGLKNRFKLRIRSYTDEPEYPRFFEIKRRLNTVIMKSRARVMDKDVPALLAGLPLPPQEFKADVDTINQFQLYIDSIQARPAVLVRYMRQAYEGDSSNRVRVTFDRELAYKITRRPEVRLGGSGWQRNPFTRTGVVLEIKFTGHFPAWLSDMVKYFNLRQRSISKFASSIEDSCMLGFCAPQVESVEYG